MPLAESATQTATQSATTGASSAASSAATESGMTASGSGLTSGATGIFSWLSGIGKAIGEYQYVRRLSNDMKRFERKATTAEMLGALSTQADIQRSTAARRKLARDITRMTSPETIQRRASRKRDYGTEAISLTRGARAAGGGRASLQAARLGRRGYELAQQRNIDEAMGDIERDVGTRVAEYQQSQEEMAARARKRRMLFDMFSRHLGAARQRSAAAAAKHQAKVNIASSILPI